MSAKRSEKKILLGLKELIYNTLTQIVRYLAVDSTPVKNLTGSTEYLADLTEYPDRRSLKEEKMPENPKKFNWDALCSLNLLSKGFDATLSRLVV